MDINQRKQLLSRSYVGAIAAQIGLRSAIPDVDDDSVDLILKGRGFHSTIRNPQIEVQLKCTELDKGCSEFFSFQLPVKNYNDLRGDNLLCPRYLFVLVVPQDSNYWLSYEVDHMKIKYRCYWISLKDLDTTHNENSITIKIPRKNLLTASSLKSIMELASNREVAA